MSKQGKNPLWDYFKISNEDVSKAVCILCKKNLSRGRKDPHKMTITTNLSPSFSKVALTKFWLRHILTLNSKVLHIFTIFKI